MYQSFHLNVHLDLHLNVYKSIHFNGHQNVHQNVNLKINLDFFSVLFLLRYGPFTTFLGGWWVGVGVLDEIKAISALLSWSWGLG